jgi:hypothetical protein
LDRLGSEIEELLANGLALDLYFRRELRAARGITGLAFFKAMRRPFGFLLFFCFGKRIAADRIAPG